MYQIILDKKIDKETKSIPEVHMKKIMDKISELASNPKPITSTKLVNSDGYRIIVGDYRVIYTIDEVNEIVCIYKINHRKNIYDNI